MRGLVRLLMMFGPMIINQVTRMNRNRQRQQQQQPRQRQPQYGRQEDPRARRQYTKPTQYKDLNKELGRDGRGRAVTAEERNFNLKEDEIMLTEDELKHYKHVDEQVEKMDGESTSSREKDTELDDEYSDFFESED